MHCFTSKQIFVFSYIVMVILFRDALEGKSRIEEAVKYLFFGHG